MKVIAIPTEDLTPALRIVAETAQDEIVLKSFAGISGMALIEIADVEYNGDGVSQIKISVV